MLTKTEYLHPVIAAFSLKRTAEGQHSISIQLPRMQAWCDDAGEPQTEPEQIGLHSLEGALLEQIAEREGGVSGWLVECMARSGLDATDAALAQLIDATATAIERDQLAADLATAQARVAELESTAE